MINVMAKPFSASMAEMNGHIVEEVQECTL